MLAVRFSFVSFIFICIACPSWACNSNQQTVKLASGSHNSLQAVFTIPYSFLNVKLTKIPNEYNKVADENKTCH